MAKKEKLPVSLALAEEFIAGAASNQPSITASKQKSVTAEKHRTMIYLEESTFRALKLRCATTDEPMTEVIEKTLRKELGLPELEPRS